MKLMFTFGHELRNVQRGKCGSGNMYTLFTHTHACTHTHTHTPSSPPIDTATRALMYKIGPKQSYITMSCMQWIDMAAQSYINTRYMHMHTLTEVHRLKRSHNRHTHTCLLPNTALTSCSHPLPPSPPLFFRTAAPQHPLRKAAGLQQIDRGRDRRQH